VTFEVKHKVPNLERMPENIRLEHQPRMMKIHNIQHHHQRYANQAWHMDLNSSAAYRVASFERKLYGERVGMSSFKKLDILTSSRPSKRYRRNQGGITSAALVTSLSQ